MLEPTLPSPWRSPDGKVGPFRPDLVTLAERFAQPMQETKVAASGNWAATLDLWIADELRRAGFPADEVWPRATLPRVLPREVALLLEEAPAHLRTEIAKLVSKKPSVAPRDARILGKAYVKQVDVVMSQWSRGPELMVSSKTMMSAFRKNLPNRFEEAYGDAANLRGRYPLCSIGFLYLMRATVLNEHGTLQKAADMLRKLRDPATYDATGLLLVDYSDDPEDLDIPIIVEAEVPADLQVGRFFDDLIGRVLDVAPVEFHVEAREKRDGLDLSIDEGESWSSADS